MKQVLMTTPSSSSLPEAAKNASPRRWLIFLLGLMACLFLVQLHHRRLTGLMDQFRFDKLAQCVLKVMRFDRGATASSRLWENSRPIAAPICAISLIGDRRSSRAVSESCNVDGMASGDDEAERARPVGIRACLHS